MWIRGSIDGELAVAERLLLATHTIVLATGIVKSWAMNAGVVAQTYHRLEDRFPGRFVLGVGAGHRESNKVAYEEPYAAVKKKTRDLRGPILLAREQNVVLGSDRNLDRSIARAAVEDP